MRRRTGLVQFPLSPEVKRALEAMAKAELRTAGGQVARLVEDAVIAAGYLKKPARGKKASAE